MLSPLTKGRGLKPHTKRRLESFRRSPLTKGRGLKRRFQLDGIAPAPVAPYKGAWIETLTGGQKGRRSNVAPYKGAWIETQRQTAKASCALVAPYKGAWIETRINSDFNARSVSPLTKGRGLKLGRGCGRVGIASKSPLTKGRGLKPPERIFPLNVARVAPYKGAWIETAVYKILHTRIIVAPYKGAWIETSMKERHPQTRRVAPYKGAWIETSCSHPVNRNFCGRPLQRGVD